MRQKVQLFLFTGLLACLALFPHREAAAQTIDSTELDSMLAQNRSDVEFLDIVASNLPKESDLQKRIVASLEESVRLDFFARMWRLQGRSGDSFRQLRASRVALREGYRRALGYYVDTGWVLLESSAPGIVRSEDPVAGHYMKLGFRDLEAARILYRQGVRHARETPTLAIRAYSDGLRRIRRARRYGLLALVESRTPMTEKDRFRTVSLDDLRENPDDEKDTRSHFQIVQDRLINLISRRILDASVQSASRGYPIQLDLLELHEDNYGRLLGDREAQLDRIYDELDVSSFHKEESLPKRNTLNRFEIPASDSDPIEPLRDAKPGEEKPDQNP
ncbi:MAG: hypothetical protein F9K24_11925 [Leptonema illini]|uniref:Uncharacterized protein n=1 Tax=Leptonema illini TaxID=183 RepID=A0A833LX15_9LEPT|nr:MAG: hypothetical protein F9K24_11925 [Leptonema illini]